MRGGQRGSPSPGRSPLAAHGADPSRSRPRRPGMKAQSNVPQVVCSWELHIGLGPASIRPLENEASGPPCGASREQGGIPCERRRWWVASWLRQRRPSSGAGGGNSSLSVQRQQPLRQPNPAGSISEAASRMPHPEHLRSRPGDSVKPSRSHTSLGVKRARTNAAHCPWWEGSTDMSTYGLFAL